MGADDMLTLPEAGDGNGKEVVGVEGVEEKGDGAWGVVGTAAYGSAYG